MADLTLMNSADSVNHVTRPQLKPTSSHPRSPLDASEVVKAVQQLLQSLGIGGELPSTACELVTASSKLLTISEVADAYLVFAKKYYFPPAGSSCHEAENIEFALRPLQKLFGDTPAAAFGALRLKQVRDEMVAMGWCRKQINKQVGRVRRMFKWAVENEMIPASVYQSLHAVAGLRVGRTAARESEPVRPVPEELIEPVLAHVSLQVAAMVRLQLLTGMRPGEVVIMRTADIDVSSTPWLYRPSRHKTEHHGHERLVFLGPQAQEVVRPFLRHDEPQRFLFSPAEAEAHRRRKLTERRVTPMSCGNRPGTNRQANPKKQARDGYDTHSYGRAIKYACRRAFPLPPDMTAEESKAWHAKHHWHPHQLRHNAATRLRRQFGLDVVQVVLGHKTLEVTQVYAERNAEAARLAMAKEG